MDSLSKVDPAIIVATSRAEHHESGGAFEQPELFCQEVRDGLRSLR